mmetsp:Transcript_12268/g.37427  ORF Transcript_12268/g.37427 Transcript_12268/m.37427 type:complete len:130 (+) Transcript_12268:237-626(+)
MAHYFASSQLWRKMVQRSKESNKSAFLVIGGIMGACYVAGHITMRLTTGAMVDSKELEDNLRHNMSGRQTMELGQNMLASVLSEVKENHQVEEGYEKVRIPKTMWHPDVEDEEVKNHVGKKYSRTHARR